MSPILQYRNQRERDSPMKKVLLVFVLSLVLSTHFLFPAIVVATVIEESTSESDYEEEIQETSNNQEQQGEESETESDGSSDQTSAKNLEESSIEDTVEGVIEDQLQRNQRLTSIVTSTISDWHIDEPILIATINMELTTAFNGVNPGAYNVARVYGISNQFSRFSVRAVDAHGNDISAAFFTDIRSDYVDFRTRADSSPGNGWITLEIFGFVNKHAPVDIIFDGLGGYFDFGELTFGIFVVNMRGDTVRREPDVTSSTRLMALGGILNVTHIDESGKEIGDAESNLGMPGAEYTTEALNLDEFYLLEIRGEASGNYILGRVIEVTYVYAKSALTAEVVPQTIDLGGRLTESQLTQAITNVSLNGGLLSSDEYTLNINKSPDTSIVGTTTSASVVLNHNRTSQQLILEIPITVTFGNAIRFSGFNDYSAGIYTWHSDIGIITARRGTTSTTGNVHNNFSGIYYNFSIHDLGDNTRRVIGTDTLTYSYDVRGTQTIASAVSDFGNGFGETNAKVGDIVEVYHREPTRLRKYDAPHSESERVNSLNNRAYFELTSNGYSLLTFDRAHPNPTTIQLGMSEKELEANISKYLDLSDTSHVSISGFQEYPDTSKIGQVVGIIRVEERLSTGKFILRDYEVPFTVEPGRLELANVTNGNFNFGIIEHSSRHQEVAAKGEHAPTITIDDYSNTTQWSIFVSASPFVNSEKQVLTGATMILKDLSVQETVHTGLTVPSKDIVLSHTPKLVGAMSNPNELYEGEHGTTEIQIGEVMNGSLTGVQLRLPANTPVDDGTYRSVITWELVGDPTLGGSE